MSRRGNCHDNAVMESCFSTVKTELADRLDTCGEAKRELFDFIEVFYIKLSRSGDGTETLQTVAKKALGRLP
jgi:putative transposase